MKNLLWAGIGALGFGTLLTVSLFLFGTFNDTVVRLILTTFTVGIFSLTAFVSVNNQNNFTTVLAYAGSLSSGLASVMILSVIWSEDWRWTDGKSKFTLVMCVFSFATAHSSLLLRALSFVHKASTGLILGTVGCITIVSLMIIFLIISEDIPESDLFFRLLATFTVLAVAGSIATPMVKKLTSQSAYTVR